MAVRRNQIVPGHVVSWRFAEPGAAERVAVLVPGATPTRFKVIAYNLGDTPIHARMTGWDVAPGQWRVTQGFDANDDDKADGPTTARSFAFERTASTELVFAPRRTSVFEFERVAPGDDPASRPDVGLGREDVRVAGNAVAVTVHSLGSADAPSSTVTLEDGGGRVLARAAVAPLAAPRDLLPKTATVRLTAPGGVRPGYRVRVSLDGGAREITQLNNEVLTP
jgi:hypothetical protein